MLDPMRVRPRRCNHAPVQRGLEHDVFSHAGHFHPFQPAKVDGRGGGHVVRLRRAQGDGRAGRWQGRAQKRRHGFASQGAAGQSLTGCMCNSPPCVRPEWSGHPRLELERNGLSVTGREETLRRPCLHCFSGVASQGGIN